MATVFERTAAEYFDRRAEHYDEQARLGMPRRDEMLAADSPYKRAIEVR